MLVATTFGRIKTIEFFRHFGTPVSCIYMIHTNEVYVRSTYPPDKQLHVGRSCGVPSVWRYHGGTIEIYFWLCS